MSSDQSLETGSHAEAGADELARTLGAAIADLEEYRTFQEARAVVEDDEAAQAALSEFRRVREAFVLARQTGDATEEDVRELQAARESLDDVPAMKEFLDAQAALEDRLQGLNQEISESLVIDFGERAGGCCQD